MMSLQSFSLGARSVSELSTLMNDPEDIPELVPAFLLCQLLLIAKIKINPRPWSHISHVLFADFHDAHIVRDAVHKHVSLVRNLLLLSLLHKRTPTIYFAACFFFGPCLTVWTSVTHTHGLKNGREN